MILDYIFYDTDLYHPNNLTLECMASFAMCAWYRKVSVPEQSTTRASVSPGCVINLLNFWLCVPLYTLTAMNSEG